MKKMEKNLAGAKLGNEPWIIMMFSIILFHFKAELRK